MKQYDHACMNGLRLGWLLACLALLLPLTAQASELPVKTVKVEGDFADVLDTHRRSGAQLTLCCTPVSENEASGVGLVSTDRDGRVLGFAEKPAHVIGLGEGDIRMLAQIRKHLGHLGARIRTRSHARQLDLGMHNQQTQEFDASVSRSANDTRAQHDLKPGFIYVLFICFV